MNRILRSSVQRVGLLTRSVAQPNASLSVRNHGSYMKPSTDVVYYGGTTLFFTVYAYRGMSRYRKKEEKILSYADK